MPEQQVVAGGMPRDGLMALVDPEMLSTLEVDRLNSENRGKFLLPDDRVVGIVIAGEARAYPYRLLRWHEAVNDTVAGVPVLITYNPLCDAVMVAGRTVDGEVLEFGVSGLLYNSNLLLYDRCDDPSGSSLWSQLQGRAVAGPAAIERRQLQLLPAAASAWGDWLRSHPETVVLAPIANLNRLYKRDPYHSYFGSDLLRFPVDPLPPPSDLVLKDRVVVANLRDTEAVFALPYLAAAAGSSRGTWTTELAGTEIEVRFDATAGTATVSPVAPADGQLAVRHAFWFAWYATHPDSPLPRP